MSKSFDYHQWTREKIIIKMTHNISVSDLHMKIHTKTQISEATHFYIKTEMCINIRNIFTILNERGQLKATQNRVQPIIFPLLKWYIHYDYYYILFFMLCQMLFSVRSELQKQKQNRVNYSV